MQSESSSPTDTTLLESWCEQQSESAFAELVRRYERLVMGAALRRAGDVELAREVTQQVFTILAAKAWLLVGRPNIAGWLYRTAAHIASRLRASDARRLARESVAEHSHVECRDENWGILEEALLKLSAPEREALILHYFQDLSYPEMAAALNMSETAVRKRVSRGVQSLGRALRKRGLGSPKALLAGAAAVQTVYPAHTALAATAIAGVPSVSTPLPLIFHAIMCSLPTKIVVCAAGLALIPLGYQWTANARLQAEVIQLPQRFESGSRDLPGGSSEATTDLTETRAELARVETARQAAEARAAELSIFRDRVNEELVVSLGTIDGMARDFGSALRHMKELKEQVVRLTPGSPEWKDHQVLIQDAAAGLPQLLSVLREIPRLERSPAKAARFYASVLAELAGFDDAARGQLEPALNAWVTQLQYDGLAFPQRPKEPREATVAWDERRVAAMHAFNRELQALVPLRNAEGTSLFLALLVEPDGVNASSAFDLISGY